jgi:hypothetical protein
MSKSKVRIVLRVISNVILGLLTGSVLGALLSALVGLLFGVVVGLISSFIQYPDYPLDARFYESIPIAFVLIVWSPPFGAFAGAISCAVTIASSKSKYGYIAAAFSAICSALIVCLDPRWFGGFELNSFDTCGYAAVSYSLISFFAGAFVVVAIGMAKNILARFRSWRRK